jgi:basic membrane protein A
VTRGDDFSGFENVDGAHAAGLQMYREGADVVFDVAGTAGLGIFDAAVEYSAEAGHQVWAIGVDTDQYQTVMLLRGVLNTELWRTHILTSVEKLIDVGTYNVLAEWAKGTFKPGPRKEGLESGVLRLAYSGHYIDDIRAEIEMLKAKIVAGEIDVPCLPESRLALAAQLGIGPDDCHD